MTEKKQETYSEWVKKSKDLRTDKKRLKIVNLLLDNIIEDKK